MDTEEKREGTGQMSEQEVSGAAMAEFRRQFDGELCRVRRVYYNRETDTYRIIQEWLGPTVKPFATWPWEEAEPERAVKGDEGE